jgi:DNA-binding protein Fis
VLRVLGSVGGDKTRAAVILGIARSTLYSILEKATISSIE